MQPSWLCQLWQLADVYFSTASLYSICAIALDRVWNLEKPLRVFTRSRRRAKRLMLCIWALPLFIWLPVYWSLMPNSADGTVGSGKNGVVCFPSNESARSVFWVALPSLYIPAAILVSPIPSFPSPSRTYQFAIKLGCCPFPLPISRFPVHSPGTILTLLFRPKSKQEAKLNCQFSQRIPPIE